MKLFVILMYAYWWLLLAGVIFNAVLFIYQIKKFRRLRKWDMLLYNERKK